MGRLPRRAGCLALSAVLLAVAAAAGLRLGRDLPRRWLESHLATASGAAVQLGGLEWLGQGRYALLDLEASRPDAFPGLKNLRVPRLEATASFGELRRGVIPRLLVTGAVVTLDDRRPEGDAAAGPPPVDIRHLMLRDATVLTPFADPAALEVELRRSPGAGWRGAVDFKAPSIHLGALASLLQLPPIEGLAEDLDVQITLDADVDDHPLASLKAGRVRAKHAESGVEVQLEQPRLDVFRRPQDPAPDRVTFAADTFDLSAAAHEAALRLPSFEVDAGRTGDVWRATGRSSVVDELRGEFGPGLGAALEVAGLALLPAAVRGFGLAGADGKLDATVTIPPSSAFLTAPSAVAPNEPAARLEATAALDGLRLAGGEAFHHPGAVITVGVDVPSAALTADAPDGAGWPVEATIAVPALDGPLPSALQPWLPEALPARATLSGVLEPGDLHFSGETRISSTALGRLTVEGLVPMSPADEGLAADWRLELPADALRRAAAVFDAGLGDAIAASLLANGHVKGSASTPKLAGTATLRDLRIDAADSHGVTFAGRGAVGFAAETTHDGRGWRLDAHSVGVRGVAGTPWIAELPLETRGRLAGQLGADGPPALSVDGLRVRLGADGELGQVDFDGTFTLTPGGPEGGADLAVSDLGFDAWQRSLGVGLGDIELRGDIGLRLRIDRAERLRASGSLRLDGLGAVGAGGARVMEGLGGHFELAAEGGPDGALSADLSGELGGFLVLWDAYFGDLTELSTAVEGRFESAGGDTVGARLSLRPLTAAGATALAADVRRRGDRLRVSGRFESEDLEDLLDGVLRAFQTDDPALRQLSGVASLQADLEMPLAPSTTQAAPGAVRLTGRLRTRGVDAEVPGARLRGLTVEVPFDLERRADLSIAGPALRGDVQLDASEVAGLRIPRFASALDIRGDDVALVNPLELEVLGGLVSIERLGLRRLLGEPSAEAGLRLDGLSMERLTRSLDLPVLEGRLDGSLPKLSLDRQRLAVDGGGRLQLFGGEVRLRDITGEEILTPFPRIRISADIDGVDLGALTRRFDFGDMGGVVSGFVDDAVLVGGAPVSFTAQVESVKTSGVPQTVDVKAVQNLTVLGTGASPTLFDRGIQQFLKSYRYRKLGVHVELRDDLLEVRGLIREGDRELFVQGGALFGIDVVNAVPGQRVSYSAMLRRLENLDLSAVRTE
ncbi:MAG: hypothetical protein AAGM22_19540 [Acidobacteriota bacterium]